MKYQLLVMMLLIPFPANSHYLSQDEYCKNNSDGDIDAYSLCLTDYQKATETCIPQFKKCFYREHVIHTHNDDDTFVIEDVL
jgi:hypothetical protein